MASFGKVIPVIGVNNGFLGQVSRSGLRSIAPRQILATTPTQAFFGDSAVLVPDAVGGTWQSVRDFIAGGGTMTAALFAGVFNREVTTTGSFPYTPGANVIGSYLPGNIAEVVEMCDGVTVACLVGAGSCVAGGNVYLRIALNGAFPAGVVGGFEGAADGANTVNLSTVGVVWRTGVVDVNGVAEIVLKQRVAA
jgi:hypothetical protein